MSVHESATASASMPLCGMLAVSTVFGGVLMNTAALEAEAAPSKATTSALPRLAQSNTTRNSESGPIVTILQPSYASTLQATVSVVIGVQSRKYTPKTIEMFVDDKSATAGPVALDAAPSAAFNWDTKLFTDGPHRLTVRVTDSQGFIGQAEVQIYINNGKKRDLSAPALAWLNVNDGDVFKGIVDIQLKATDNFGVKYIFVSINPAATPSRKGALRQYLLNRPPYNFPFDTRKVPDGLYVLDAIAWDSLENEGKAPQRLFGVLNNSMNATLLNEINKFGGPLVAKNPVAAPTPTSPSDVPENATGKSVSGRFSTDPSSGTQTYTAGAGAGQTGEVYVAAPGTRGTGNTHDRTTYAVPAADAMTQVTGSVVNNERVSGSSLSAGQVSREQSARFIASLPPAKPRTNASATRNTANANPVVVATGPVRSSNINTAELTVSGARIETAPSQSTTEKRGVRIARQNNESLRATNPTMTPRNDGSPASLRGTTPAFSVLPSGHTSVIAGARGGASQQVPSGERVRATAPVLVARNLPGGNGTASGESTSVPALSVPAGQPAWSMAPVTSVGTQVSSVVPPAFKQSNPLRLGRIDTVLNSTRIVAAPTRQNATAGGTQLTATVSGASLRIASVQPATIPARKQNGAGRVTLPVSNPVLAALPPSQMGPRRGAAITVSPASQAQSLPVSYVT
ncbi:MAG TPA: Ig-like domain-containing protein, partial [Abditibacteriaceae bacterium]